MKLKVIRKSLCLLALVVGSTFALSACKENSEHPEGEHPEAEKSTTETQPKAP